MSNTIKQTVININTMNGNIIGAGVGTTVEDFYRQLYVYLESKTSSLLWLRERKHNALHRFCLRSKKRFERPN